MATAQASDLMTDVSKWTKALDAGTKLLKINRDLGASLDAVKLVAKEADKVSVECKTKVDFQVSMNRLFQASDAVLAVGKTLNEVESVMNKTLKKATKSSSATVESVRSCIKQLKQLLSAAEKFCEKYEEFRGCLSEAIEKCSLLLGELEKSKAAADSEASSTRWKGYSEAVGLGTVAAGALALGIAGFFTGGAAWVAYGALVAGAAASGGLTAGTAALINSTGLNAKELDAKALEFKKGVQSLSLCVNELGALSKTVDADSQLSQQIIDAIADVIQMYRERHRVLKMEEDFKERMEQLRLREKEVERREKQAAAAAAGKG